MKSEDQKIIDRCHQFKQSGFESSSSMKLKNLDLIRKTSRQSEFTRHRIGLSKENYDSNNFNQDISSTLHKINPDLLGNSLSFEKQINILSEFLLNSDPYTNDYLNVLKKFSNLSLEINSSNEKKIEINPQLIDLYLSMLKGIKKEPCEIEILFSLSNLSFSNQIIFEKLLQSNIYMEILNLLEDKNKGTVDYKENLLFLLSNLLNDSPVRHAIIIKNGLEIVNNVIQNFIEASISQEQKTKLINTYLFFVTNICNIDDISENYFLSFESKVATMEFLYKFIQFPDPVIQKDSYIALDYVISICHDFDNTIILKTFNPQLMFDSINEEDPLAAYKLSTLSRIFPISECESEFQLKEIEKVILSLYNLIMKKDPPLVEAGFKAFSFLVQYNKNYTNYSFEYYPKLFDFVFDLILSHSKEIHSIEAAHFLSEAIKNLSSKNFEKIVEKGLIDILGKSINIDLSPSFMEHLLSCIYNCYVTSCNERFQDSKNVTEEKFIQQFKSYKFEEFLKTLVGKVNHPCSDLAGSMLDLFEDNLYDEDD